MPLSLDYKLLWNKYCKNSDLAIDWLLKYGRAAGIDKKICYDFYIKYKIESSKYIKLCNDLIKKGGWYVGI